MSTFGRIYRVTTFGESHSPAVGCSVEGFPSGFAIGIEDIQKALDRRRPGQSSLTTKRNESDQVEILCGVENGITLGSPISFIVRNNDQRKNDYAEMEKVPRPGHADYTYLIKYGIKAQSGGGRSSARETIGRVCGGALADIFLEQKLNMRIFSFVASVGEIELPKDIIKQIVESKIGSFSKLRIDQMGTFKVYSTKDNQQQLFENEGKFYDDAGNEQKVDEGAIQFQETLIARCPHVPTALQIIKKIQQTREEKDSIGGTVIGVIQNAPIGLGEPCFDKLPAMLAHAMMSIPATKGFEFGSGFEGTKMNGSKHNDTFYSNKKEDSVDHDQENLLLKTLTNNAGGTLGGISNGQNIYFRVAFKPVSTIGKEQITSDLNGKQIALEAKGRHDPCVLPRVPPVVDAMSSMVMMESVLLQSTHQLGEQHWMQYEDY